MSKKSKDAGWLDQPINETDMRPKELEALLTAGDVDGALAYVTEALGPEDRPWASKMFAKWLPDEGAELASDLFAEPEPEPGPKGPKLSIAQILTAAKAGLPKAEPDELDQLAAAREREAELEERLRAAEQPRVAAEPKRGLSKSKSLGQPDGTLGECAEYVVRSAMFPVESIGHVVGIGTIGTLIGRRVAGPSGSRGCGTHTYQAVVGPSGIGKEHTEGTSKGLLTAAGATRLIGPGRFKSDAGIIQHMVNKPVSLCVMDELGAYFGRLAKPRQFEVESTAIFRNAWGKSWTRYDSPAGAAGDSVAVMSPALALIGMSTDQEIGRACQGRDAANGFLNRWEFRVEIDDPPYQKVGEKELIIPPGLREKLKKLYKLGGLETGTPKLRLKWGPGAEEIFEGLVEEVRRESDQRRKDVFRRKPERTVRIATCIAAGRFDKFVTRVDMEWALAYVVSGSEALLTLLYEYGEEEKLGFDQLCKEIIRRITRHDGWMTHRDLLRSFQGNVLWRKQLDEGLAHLVQSEQLIEGTITPEGGIGRPSRAFALPEVAQEAGWV